MCDQLKTSQPDQWTSLGKERVGRIEKVTWKHIHYQVQNIGPVGICCRMQGAQIQCSVTTQRGGMGWEVGGRLKRDRTRVYLGLIHVDLWRKPTQHRKTIILQLKIIVKKPTSRREEVAGNPQPPSLRLTVFSPHVLSGHWEATEQGWAPTG